MKVQTIVRAEASKKTDWLQAAKDAGASSFNAWCVQALDRAAEQAMYPLIPVGEAQNTGGPTPAERHRVARDPHFKPDFKK